MRGVVLLLLLSRSRAHRSYCLANRHQGRIDLLLTDMANLLRAHFPESAKIARFGDDVFTVLEPGSTPEQASPGYQALQVGTG